MEGPIYPAAFTRHGIDLRTPTPADRALVDDAVATALGERTARWRGGPVTA